MKIRKVREGDLFLTKMGFSVDIVLAVRSSRCMCGFYGYILDSESEEYVDVPIDYSKYCGPGNTYFFWYDSVIRRLKG